MFINGLGKYLVLSYQSCLVLKINAIKFGDFFFKKNHF